MKSLVLAIGLFVAGFALAFYTPLAADPQKHYVRGTNVRLRASPDLKSPVLSTLQGGTSLNVLRQSPNEETIAGKTAFWYKVTVSEQKEQVAGWIFGAFVVDESHGPAAIEKRALSESTSLPESLRLLKIIQTEFPAYNPGGLFEYKEWLPNRISVYECWINRFSQPPIAGDAAALARMAIDSIKQKNQDNLARTLACEFVFMDGYCVGDPMSGVASSHGLARIFDRAKNLDHNSWQNSREFPGYVCASLKGTADRFCLSIRPFRGRPFISVISAAQGIFGDSFRYYNSLNNQYS